MNKNVLNLGLIFIILALLTGCPGTSQGAAVPEEEPLSELSITIAAAQNEIDFNNETATENAVVSNAIVIKNLNLNGNTIKLKASGIVLQNVNNGIVVVDKQVGEGDSTLTNCNNITKLEINGGGSNSIHVNNSEIASVEVKKNNVRLALEQSSSVEEVIVEASGSKIESEENIVINAINVNDNIDTITVKGGTIKKIEVVPVEADSANLGLTEPATEKTKIVIDGKTEVNSVEGTKDVTLTNSAIENGATVSIESQEPVASFYNSTLFFISDGSVEGTVFENQDYFYEYYFEAKTTEMMTADMEAKIKIYKLADDIKVYSYAKYTDPDSGDPISTISPFADKFLHSEIKGKDLTFISLYDTTFVLKSAGIVKGMFDAEETPKTEITSYDLTFDITDCGMPQKLIFPTNPAKPNISTKAIAQGNEITITLNDNAQTIYIYPGEKINGNWVCAKKELFRFDNNSSNTVTIVDTYVNTGKEYAYFVNTNNYHSISSDTMATVTATGGKGEMTITAKSSNDGIDITVPVLNNSEDYVLFYSITRYQVGDQTNDDVRITNFYGDTFINPVIDYFVDRNFEYSYSFECDYWYQNQKYHYLPHSNTVIIQANAGLGEPIINNVPVAVANTTNKKVTFTTVPNTQVGTFPDGFRAWIAFQYSFEDENDGRTVDYDLVENNENCDISTWFNSGFYNNYVTIEYDYSNWYSVSISYPNNINYSYRYSKEHNFSIPETITIK